MGSFAQCTADEYQLTRKDMDDYALASLSRAQGAIASGAFADEIAPVTIKGRKGDTIVDTDEAPGRGMPDKIPTLKPAFAKDGTITAATSSSISGRAGREVVLTRQSTADAKGTHLSRARSPPLPRQKPRNSPSPTDRRDSNCSTSGLVGRRRRFVRVHEAFACVAMFAIEASVSPTTKINIHGGATALAIRSAPAATRNPRHPRQRTQARGSARRRDPVHRWWRSAAVAVELADPSSAGA